MRRKMRFHTKVSLAFLLGILGCMFLLNLLCSLLLQPMFIADSRRQMANYGTRLDRVLSAETENADITAMLISFRNAYLINTTILDRDGQMEYSTNYPEEQMFAADQQPEWMDSLLKVFRAQSENPYVQEHFDKENQIDQIHYVRWSESGHYIILSQSVRGIEQDVQLVSLFLILACVVAAVAGVLVWTYFTRPFSHSMERMSQVTRSLSQLDFSEKVNYRGSVTEINVLADSIDHMSDRLEQSHSELQTELERQKELLRNLSHEIKTPLTTIKGYTENMEIVAGDNERVKRYCGIILEECEALDLLAVEMIDVSTLESSSGIYEQQALEAETFFHQAEQRLRREMPQEKIKVEFDSGTLYGNPYLLQRVVFNYLGNALKYRAPDTEVFLRGRSAEGRYELSVTNSGDPIPEAEQDRIWDAFYKGDKSRQRSGSFGIGLSIVKQIANMHRAEVGVHCQDGQNTFYFSVPASEPDS